MLKNRTALALASLVCILIAAASGQAAVEWSLEANIKLEDAPRDVEVSRDGKWIYILTEAGNILVYGADGKPAGTLDVKTAADDIEAGPQADVLFLQSRENKTVQVLRLDFIQNINVAGSPFMGPADAPVVIAVFNDYQ